jgi:hypothetical protein
MENRKAKDSKLTYNFIRKLCILLCASLIYSISMSHNTALVNIGVYWNIALHVLVFRPSSAITNYDSEYWNFKRWTIDIYEGGP